jgi:stress response protein SCP2
MSKTFNFDKAENKVFHFEKDKYEEIAIEAGWDTGKTGVDLDLFAIALNSDNKIVDACYFVKEQLVIFNGAISHSGDNRTGEGDGADEIITIDLKNIPENVQKIEICFGIFAGADSFAAVNEEFMDIKDLNSNLVVATTKDADGNCKGIEGAGLTYVQGAFIKTNDGFAFEYKGELKPEHMTTYIRSFQ